MTARIKKILPFVIYFILIPAVIAIGVILLEDRKYGIVYMTVAVLSCIPFFISFERSKSSTRELVIIAVMTAIAVVGRLIFSVIPHFKPVTAIVIITAVALGRDAGFITGSLSALVANIFLGQGPWTPFQMFSWGLIGFITGVIFCKKGYRNSSADKIILAVTGLLSGAFYSMLMDIWTVVSLDGGFTADRYLLALVSSLPVMITYIVSNVIFLLVLTKPILNKLERIKKKYELFA